MMGAVRVTAPIVELALAGCGGDDGGGEKLGSTLPACVDVVPGHDVPADFPEQFPLPEGTVFSSAGTEAGARVSTTSPSRAT